MSGCWSCAHSAGGDAEAEKGGGTVEAGSTAPACRLLLHPPLPAREHSQEQKVSCLEVRAVSNVAP